MPALTGWAEMSLLEQYACTYWDMYKDAYGFRPRGIDTSAWRESDFEREFAQLSRTIEANYTERLAQEQVAMHEFEMRMQDLMRGGAETRGQALRWIHEAEGSLGDDEFLCYLLGLPYGYFREETA